MGPRASSYSQRHGLQRRDGGHSRGLHFHVEGQICILVDPQFLCPTTSSSLPAAGVPAELVDKPPAVHPLEDLPLVVVPQGTGGQRCRAGANLPAGLWPRDMGLNLIPHRKSLRSLTLGSVGHLTLPGLHEQCGLGLEETWETEVQRQAA